jgi:glucose uptake protein GlcU
MMKKIRVAWLTCGWIFVAAALAAVFVSDEWDELMEQICLILAGAWILLGAILWAGQNPAPPA